VSGYVTDGDGREWATAARAAHDLGVTPALIWLWAHRYRDRIDRHTVGRTTWYRLDQLRAVEADTTERLTRQSAKRVDA
jgi:hypothetical protein